MTSDQIGHLPVHYFLLKLRLYGTCFKIVIVSKMRPAINPAKSILLKNWKSN